MKMEQDRGVTKAKRGDLKGPYHNVFLFLNLTHKKQNLAHLPFRLEGLTHRRGRRVEKLWRRRHSVEEEGRLSGGTGAGPGTNIPSCVFHKFFLKTNHCNTIEC